MSMTIRRIYRKPKGTARLCADRTDLAGLISAQRSDDLNDRVRHPVALVKLLESLRSDRRYNDHPMSYYDGYGWGAQ